MSRIKIGRARRISLAGKYPGTFAALLDGVSHGVIESVSAKTLAVIIDDMWRASERSKWIAERDAIKEGAIWDAQQNRLREIAA